MGTETQVSHRQQYENKMKEDYGSYRRNFYRCKKKPGKIQACTGFEPLTSARYRCSALPIELTSQLGAGHLVGSL